MYLHDLHDTNTHASVPECLHCRSGEVAARATAWVCMNQHAGKLWHGASSEPKRRGFLSFVSGVHMRHHQAEAVAIAAAAATVLWIHGKQSTCTRSFVPGLSNRLSVCSNTNATVLTAHHCKVEALYTDQHCTAVADLQFEGQRHLCLTMAFPNVE